mmetsp:Transcript_16502/g.19840  ORF Transcript_16502/g.19840 Transcript_16502/m.19840 type:complete len:222 (-) Transcript_16502:441-1106(-)|eukprot:CAMPEP_0195268810 /NCGR_PEP_ID=MMETSP0706-20130129/13388_1 /TAXON_ID=33640 /ORGANISM="Asterionellopsis glacialis, Strain CCMP134" /LENGTH=221 /DNA_ID=CAMNT_0040323785 /DNA_START=93 /DNA_END=761 /DNA_ORIENTATION=-
MVMSKVVYLGAGEYIGTEKFLRVDFPKKYGNKIIKSVKSGYMSPFKEKKLNKKGKERVSEARTKESTFVEVVKVELAGDPEDHIEVLFKFFFSFHDATLSYHNHDLVGHWANSHIFYSDEDQAAIAQKVREHLQSAITNKVCTAFQNDTIETKIVEKRPFFEACLSQQDFSRIHPFKSKLFNRLKKQKIYFEEWPNATKHSNCDDTNQLPKYFTNDHASFL